MIDPDVCCSGECSQGKDCPRYRQETPEEPKFLEWLVGSVCGCLGIAAAVWIVFQIKEAFPQ